jgi:hypothetical protein
MNKREHFRIPDTTSKEVCLTLAQFPCTRAREQKSKIFGFNESMDCIEKVRNTLNFVNDDNLGRSRCNERFKFMRTLESLRK